MKNFATFLSSTFILLLLTGCPKPTPKFPLFELGKPFVLAHGSTMQTADNALIIQFTQVSADSRCPQGVQCIWAGRADCVFNLTQGDVAESVTLSSGDFSQGGIGKVNFNGYTITLNDVAPPKIGGEPIKQEDYRATLTVTKL